MYLKTEIYIISFIFLLGLISCSKEYPFETFNINGGESRANAYDNYGTLPMVFLSKEEIQINDSTGVIQAPVAFGAQDYIIATASGKVIRLVDTRSKWVYQLDSNVIALTGIAGITSNELTAFVTSDHYLISLDKNGELNFKSKFDFPITNFLTYSEILALKDAFIVGTGDGYVCKYDLSGKLAKQLQFGKSITRLISAENNIVAFGVTHNWFGQSDTLIIADRDLNIKSQIKIDNLRILAGPIVNDGKIYLAGSVETEKGRLGRIVAFDYSGNLIYDIETDMVIRTISVDKNGIIFAAGFNSGVAEYYSGLYSFDTSGKERWTLYLKSSVNSPLIVCKKYITFAGLTTEGAGIFSIRHKDGLLTKLHALNEMPLLYLHPAITTEPMLVLFGSERPLIIKLNQTQLDKIIPW